MTCRLCILRHGQTEANLNRLYCGSTDLPLSPAGREELAALKAAVSYPAAAFGITSGLRRADETMALLFGLSPDRILPALTEYNFGEFEMQSYETLKERADYQAWITDKTGEVACPGGESRIQFEQRVLAAYEEVLQSVCTLHDSVAMVCHGGVIATVMHHSFAGDKNFYDWQPQAGHGYILTVEDGICASYTPL